MNKKHPIYSACLGAAYKVRDSEISTQQINHLEQRLPREMYHLPPQDVFFCQNVQT